MSRSLRKTNPARRPLEHAVRRSDARSLRAMLLAETARANAVEQENRDLRDKLLQAETARDAAEHKADTYVQLAIETREKLARSDARIAENAERTETLAAGQAAAEHKLQTYIDLAAELREQVDHLKAEFNRMPYSIVPEEPSPVDSSARLGNPARPKSRRRSRNRDLFTRPVSRNGDHRRTTLFASSPVAVNPQSELKNSDDFDPPDPDGGSDDQPQFARLRPVKPPPLREHQPAPRDANAEESNDRGSENVWNEWQMAGAPVG
jgi:hypothetical protein